MKILFDRQEPEEGFEIPHHTDRWYNRSQRLWVVQLKDKFDNQIGEAHYDGKQGAIDYEKSLKKEYDLK
jgi:hypothetical protein